MNKPKLKVGDLFSYNSYSDYLGIIIGIIIKKNTYNYHFRTIRNTGTRELNRFGVNSVMARNCTVIPSTPLNKVLYG